MKHWFYEIFIAKVAMVLFFEVKSFQLLYGWEHGSWLMDVKSAS
jgi:hypothetical protein